MGLKAERKRRAIILQKNSGLQLKQLGDMAVLSSNKMTMLFNRVLVFFLLLSVSSARDVKSSSIALPPTLPRVPIPAGIVCTSVYGVKSGDTCFAVEQMFHLTPAKFEEFNPNLNCEALFVGEWLCTGGFFSEALMTFGVWKCDGK
ncbi:hypothetical protein NL676_012991 [Syzygium grande]|nr:hypothetical protein NL676_012991 [Syzygium grande]